MNRRFRLRKSGDFKIVRGQGRSWANPLAVLYVRRSGLADSRIGFSVSKRIGKAVVRNRVKRLLREAVRVRLGMIDRGWDLLFIGRTPIAQADYAMVSAAVERLLGQSGVLLGQPGNQNMQAKPPAGTPAAGEQEGLA